MQSGFHGSNFDTQDGGYLFERQFLILKKNQRFPLRQREHTNGLPNYLRLFLLQKDSGQLRCVVDLCARKLYVPIAQPVISPGEISGSTIEVPAQGAFGWIETARGIEKPQKTLLCDVFRSRDRVG
jgi:hypothetical protein